jgi:hypothetical protein
LLLKTFTESDENNIDELAVVEFAELVGEGLEPLTINPHGGVSLDNVAELGVQGVDAGVDVVLKQLTEGRPKRGGIGGIPENEIEDLGGHPFVDPLDDGEVVLYPARIRRLGNRVGVDVAEEISAA